MLFYFSFWDRFHVAQDDTEFAIYSASEPSAFTPWVLGWLWWLPDPVFLWQFKLEVDQTTSMPFVTIPTNARAPFSKSRFFILDILSLLIQTL